MYVPKSFFVETKFHFFLWPFITLAFNVLRFKKYSSKLQLLQDLTQKVLLHKPPNFAVAIYNTCCWHDMIKKDYSCNLQL